MKPPAAPLPPEPQPCARNRLTAPAWPSRTLILPDHEEPLAIACSALDPGSGGEVTVRNDHYTVVFDRNFGQHLQDPPVEGLTHWHCALATAMSSDHGRFRVERRRAPAPIPRELYEGLDAAHGLLSLALRVWNSTLEEVLDR